MDHLTEGKILKRGNIPYLYIWSGSFKSVQVYVPWVMAGGINFLSPPLVFHPSCFLYILYPFYSTPPHWTLSSISSFKSMLCTNWLPIGVWTTARFWLGSTSLELFQSSISTNSQLLKSLQVSFFFLLYLWALSLQPGLFNSYDSQAQPSSRWGVGIGEMPNFFQNCPIQSTSGCWQRS